jgi:virulence factor
LDDLLTNVDAVSIATPTPTHYEIIQRCIEHHVHFLVEKPVIGSIDHIESLTELVEKSGLIIQVGHIERFNPTYVELKHVLENQNIFAINFQRLSPYRVSNKDVDVVLDLMVHDLDLCNDLTGLEPIAINAFGLNPMSDTLDYVAAQLIYSTGMVMTLTASRITEQKVRSVDVTTEDAYVEADFLNKSIYIHRCSTGEYSSNNNNGVKYQQESMIQRIMVPSAEPLALEIKHFVNCIIQGSKPSVPFSAGIQAFCLAERILNQANSINYKIAHEPQFSPVWTN